MILLFPKIFSLVDYFRIAFFRREVTSGDNFVGPFVRKSIRCDIELSEPYRFAEHLFNG